MSEHAVSKNPGHPNYFGIMIYLAILTAIEVALAIIPGLAWNMVVFGMLALMVIKAILIAMFFMHLRFERLTFFMVCATPAVLSLVLFFGLTPDM
jgi:cytochrome c oxidase subunit 4